nr:uridine 5'-monophosphate synthase [Tanacetum cinerariifolium]
MLMRRKKVNDYGNSKVIEGHYKIKYTCLLVDDLVTSGVSILETTAPLRTSGHRVTDAVALIDRQQGAKENLEKNMIRLHTMLKLRDIVKVLNNKKSISNGTASMVFKFLEENKNVRGATPLNAVSKVEAGISDEERTKLVKNSTGKRLFEVIVKKSNLCLSVDVNIASELLAIADK